MKALIVLTAAAVAAATLTATASPARQVKTEAQITKSLRTGIAWHRSMTWRYQDRAGVARTPSKYRERTVRSVAYLRWDIRLWSDRRVRARALAHRMTSGSIPTLICRVFGAACAEAKSIAWTESKWSTHPYPGNPTHFGIFQLDAPAIRAYARIGYTTAYQQIVAAHIMYLHRGFEPWTCCEG